MKLTELRWQDPRTKTYLGSPSIVRLPSGKLLATHDYFGPGAPRTHEGMEGLTSVHSSSDGGASWENTTHIMNACWGNLFVHDGSVYHLGCSQEYGSIVIRRSDDEGKTWTFPLDGHSGLLFRGGIRHENPNYHGASTSILFSKGRIYRAFEDALDASASWRARCFQSLVISAPEGSDLLEASNWTMSGKLDSGNLKAPPEWTDPGWLEGNMVEAPDGTLWNIIRINSFPDVNKAAMIKVSDSGKRVDFDPATGIIDFPGGLSRFTIRKDPVSGVYLALSNPVFDKKNPCQRNVLSLCASSDLRNWKIVMNLLEDDSGLSEQDSLAFTGFQYADWQFDGDDMICLVRTSYNGAHSHHDSNRITFHALKNFRRHLEK